MNKPKTQPLFFLHHVLSATRSPKSGSSQDPPYLDTSVPLQGPKPPCPAPLFPVDGTVSRLAVLFQNQSQNHLYSVMTWASMRQSPHNSEQPVLKVESNEALQLISFPFVSSLQWMRSLVLLQKSVQLRARATQKKARAVKVCFKLEIARCRRGIIKPPLVPRCMSVYFEFVVSHLH